jgi:hypothetical protein
LVLKLPSGWGRRESGDSVCLFSLEFPTHGEIRYRERTVPLRRLSQVVEEALIVGSPFTEQAARQVEPMVTAEGEYAALATLRGLWQGQPAYRNIGCVFAEEFCTVLDSLVIYPPFFDSFARIARELLFSDELRLGLRRRRFLFRSPPAWHRLAHGLTTRLYPASYPIDKSLIGILPAEPLSLTSWSELAARLTAERQAELHVEHEFAPIPFSSPAGLAGKVFYTIGRSADSRQQFRYTVLLADRHYSYVVTLSSESPQAVGDHYQRLLELAASIRPLVIAASLGAAPKEDGATEATNPLWTD